MSWFVRKRSFTSIYNELLPSNKIMSICNLKGAKHKQVADVYDSQNCNSTVDQTCSYNIDSYFGSDNNTKVNVERSRNTNQNHSHTHKNNQTQKRSYN